MAGTNHFSRMNYHVQRGMRELLSPRTLSNTEWEEIKSYFGNLCAFCGCEDNGNPRTGIVPDHLIPAVEHGEYCIGNIVPSCQNCNDHRGKKEWRNYLLSEFTKHAEARVSLIEKYLEQYPYETADDHYEYLTNEETEKYLKILEEWNGVWDKARALRDSINERREKEKT